MTIETVITTTGQPEPVKIGYWYWVEVPRISNFIALSQVVALDESHVVYETYQPAKFWGYKKTGFTFKDELMEFQDNSVRDYTR